MGARRAAVRDAVRPAPPVADPREILPPGNGPGLEILFVLRDAGERLVVLPGLVSGLPPRPERAPAPTRGTPGARVALRVGDPLRDGAELRLGDVRVVLDGQRDGQVRLVELVPEAGQAAHSADARPRHPAVRLAEEEEERKKERKKEQKQNKRRGGER